jgi:hypothetical protein
MKVFKEYENVTQNVLFGNAVLAVLMSGRKYDAIPQNVRILIFLKQSPLSKHNVVTELNMENVHLQIMLSDVG